MGLYVVNAIGNRLQERFNVTFQLEFQKPIDKDGYICDESKCYEFGEEAIEDLLNNKISSAFPFKIFGFSGD